MCVSTYVHVCSCLRVSDICTLPKKHLDFTIYISPSADGIRRNTSLVSMRLHVCSHACMCACLSLRFRAVQTCTRTWASPNFCIVEYMWCHISAKQTMYVRMHTCTHVCACGCKYACMCSCVIVDLLKAVKEVT